MCCIFLPFCWLHNFLVEPFEKQLCNFTTWQCRSHGRSTKKPVQYRVSAGKPFEQPKHAQKTRFSAFFIELYLVGLFKSNTRSKFIKNKSRLSQRRNLTIMSEVCSKRAVWVIKNALFWHDKRLLCSSFLVSNNVLKPAIQYSRYFIDISIVLKHHTRVVTLPMKSATTQNTSRFLPDCFPNFCPIFIREFHGFNLFLPKHQQVS